MNVAHEQECSVLENVYCRFNKLLNLQQSILEVSRGKIVAVKIQNVTARFHPAKWVQPEKSVSCKKGQEKLEGLKILG